MRRFLIFCISFILCSQLMACQAFESTSTSEVTSEQSTVTSNRPKKIAMLLPLQGKYGESGQAIRNGFMAAFYAHKNHSDAAPVIKVLDTSGQNINTVYQQAVSEGAEVIIGPLDKEQVQSLIKTTTLKVPTVALNSVTTEKIPNLIQFALSQTDEADQVATRAFQNGHRRALIIAPAGSWGNGIVDAFKNRWQKGGGEIADQLSYQNPNQLSEQIRQVLRAEKAGSHKTKAKPLAQEDGKPIIHRRQDIDMIFLVAEPERARQIIPLLKFYYAGKIPVYATSLIYSGVSSPAHDNDLDNIQFTDMPWVLGGLSDHLQAIQQNAAELWKNSYSHNPKLYALGADAYQLSMGLNQLKSSPNQSIHGGTGTLHLQENQHILRELPWAKIRNGNPSILQ